MSDVCRKSSALPILGKVNVNFYCSSSTVFHLYEKENEFERQKNIKHLGLISKVFEGASHTRYEYLMLQSCLADILDNLHKGSATVAQGEIKINGKKYSGNCLLKSWFLLSNFGHAKNTIGDEKSLLLFSLKQQGFRSSLLTPIRDETLRKWSNSVIDNFEYVKFHYILSIRRMYKSLPRQVDVQYELAKLFKLLLINHDETNYRVDNNKLEQLRRIFKTIRALSIIAIDGHYSHSPISVDLISTILSLDSLENSYKGIFILESFKPLLSSLHESLYMDKNVLAIQREYEIKSLQKLNIIKKNNKSYDSMIDLSLFEGITHLDNFGLVPFLRMSIPETMQSRKFYDDLIRLQTVKRGCKGVEASLDLNPTSNIRCADFFIESKSFHPEQLPRFVYNILTIIRSQIREQIKNTSKEFKSLLDEFKDNAIKHGVSENTIGDILDKSKNTLANHAWQGFKRDIFPIFRDLFWSILSYFLKDIYHIDIYMPEKEYDVFGMKFPDIELGLSDNVRLAIEKEKGDKDRAHELEQLLKSVNRKFNGYVFVCLARIIIYNPAKPPSERKVTDIDSCLIKAGQKQIIIELHEAKNYSRNREGKAAKEIRKKFVPLLNFNAKGYRVKEVKKFGAKLVIHCKSK